MSDYITIELSQQGKHKGKYKTIIDNVDNDLAKVRWSSDKGRYALREDNGIFIYLHRVILARKLERDELLPTEYVDHIDGDGLNNRRENLRLATNAQNLANRGKTKSNTSGYKGVTWSKYAKKWKAAITVNRKSIHLGYFENILDADEACREARQGLHGDFTNHGD